MTKIYHAHLYGSREDKYQVLLENTINTTNFTEVKPQKPFYLLIPQDNDLFSEYNRYFKITDIMPVNNTGVISKRDSLAFQFEKESVKKIVTDIFNLSEEEIVEKYPLQSWSSRDGKVEYVKESVIKNGLDDSKFLQILYRIFDKRWTYYNTDSKGFIAWPVFEVMKNMLFGNNLALFTNRQINGKFTHIFCSKEIINDCTLSNATRERSYLFPLYLYPDKNKPKELQQEKRSNFSQDFFKKIENILGYLPTPEAIFYYIYAIFHSPTYRTRYAEFLKIDFPKVPITSNKKLFTELSELGEQLTQLHLMTSPRLDKPITKFISESDQIVTPGHPKYINNNVYINKTDHFKNVPETVWNFHIGGYQVCQKWLKDRKGRTLSAEDITHYQKIIIALLETIKLMEKIDRTIPSFPIE